MTQSNRRRPNRRPPNRPPPKPPLPEAKVEFLLSRKFPGLDIDQITDVQAGVEEGLTFGQAVQQAMQEDQVPEINQGPIKAALWEALPFVVELQKLSPEHLDAMYKQEHQRH